MFLCLYGKHLISLCSYFQAVASNMKTLSQKGPVFTALLPKVLYYSHWITLHLLSSHVMTTKFLSKIFLFLNMQSTGCSSTPQTKPLAVMKYVMFTQHFLDYLSACSDKLYAPLLLCSIIEYFFLPLLLILI